MTKTNMNRLMMRHWWFLLQTTSALVAAFDALVWEERKGYDGDGRHHPITFANETHGFLLTGSTDVATATSDFYMYEEATDTWTDLSSSENSKFPGRARSFGYGTVLNSVGHTKAYLGFGTAADSERLNDWWEFDMSTHTWKELTPLPGPGRRHPAVVPVLTSDGLWEIHVGLGDGYIGYFTNFNDWYSYDVNSGTWTQLPDFPGSERHHPFYFGLGPTSYVGLGHSASNIERDFYGYNDGWERESDFASYDVDVDVVAKEKTVAFSEQLVTTEARVAGTQFSIELPPLEINNSSYDTTSSLFGSIGFVLSGDGDDHRSMDEGEFHAYYPANSNNTIISGPNNNHNGWWRHLPSHPGRSRWAPGSFVMRGTARAYFTSGYDRVDRTLYADLWRIDLTPLFLQNNNIPTIQPSPLAPSSTPSPTKAPMLGASPTQMPDDTTTEKPTNKSNNSTSGAAVSNSFAIVGALLSWYLLCLFF